MRKKQKRVHYRNAPDLVARQELLGYDDLKLLGVPYSKVHIWRLIRAGKFPAPVKFGDGPNCRAFFRRGDVLKFTSAA